MGSAAYVPQEIVMDILARLPVKSLLRFRCVCKSWRSFINNPYFARKNLNHLNNKENGKSVAVLTVYSTSYTNPANAVFTTILKSNHQGTNNENDTIVSSVMEVDCPAKLKSCFTRIWGSCDGILCIVLDRGDSVLLWNPSINKYKILPPSNLRYGWSDVCGIGYDPSVDDYKVLRANTQLGAPMNSVEVLALKSNSWKTTQDNYLPYQTFFAHHSVFTNGGIHWVAESMVSRKVVVLCFDVVAEKFREVPLPHISHIHSIALMLLKEHLCYMQYHWTGRVDIWVMKEYGFRESWDKLVTVVPEFLGFRLNEQRLSPICFMRTGIVLFKEKEGSKELFMYKRSDGNYRKLWTGNVAGKCQEVLPYVESLISPIVGYEN